MSAISTKIYAKDSSGTLRELQPETTISNVSGLQTALDGKVDTVSGKGLSTNDYTTTEKNKLAGIANNANNYVHPTTSGNKHIPSGGSSGKILGWSADGTAAWVDPTGGGGGGDVSSIKVGSATYNPDSSGVVSLPAYPTSLPASDVYSWAKTSSKPTYNADEISSSSTTNKFVTASEKSTWNNKGTYSKPSKGIPKSDLISTVQTSLERAETAYTTCNIELPSGNLTNASVERNYNCTLAGYTETIAGKSGWVVITTYCLNSTKTRRLQSAAFDDGTRKTRFYSGSWAEWI